MGKGDCSYTKSKDKGKTKASPELRNTARIKNHWLVELVLGRYEYAYKASCMHMQRSATYPPLLLVLKRELVSLQCGTALFIMAVHHGIG